MTGKIDSKDELLQELLGIYEHRNQNRIETRWYDGASVSGVITDEFEDELRELLE